MKPPPHPTPPSQEACPLLAHFPPPQPVAIPQIECKERTSELTALVAKEKKAFEESLRRFQEKGAALRAALETAQKRATGNVATLKEKHQVNTYALALLLLGGGRGGGS